MAESFQPIPVAAPGDNRWLFAVRCLVDLQLLSVYRFLRRELAPCRGRVLEHVPDASAFMAEVARVVRPGGSLVLTVPWSARLHHLPHDYRRLTRQGLVALFEASGFTDIRIEERGNDVAVVANKLIVMLIRVLRPAKRSQRIWCWPLALVLAPVASGFVIAAHVSMRLGLGSREDPLGYGVVATKG